ncbi:methyl-accepting chemotaxis protein [Paenibacillus sp. YPG26]|uniref:methyl-accepting chemotaxis protein n=1 Tax=Paenibacillus sp. YPG26 TaxID=2878915 RepID=UPI00203D3B36|nr:methyl-accepting chemotaxis protein [Paenibacillus sp. YPG26]USB32983.1 methyl-accepting chemotaxis protein [Paenibacillus sp. YPG26]
MDKDQQKNVRGGAPRWLHQWGQMLRDPNTGKWKLNPKKSVGIRLFLFYFIGVFIIVSLVGGQSYSMARQSIMDEVSGFSEQTIIESSKNLDMAFGKYQDGSLQFIVDQKFLEDLRTLASMKKNTLEYMEQQKAMNAYLKNSASSDENIRSITLFKPDGSALSSSADLNLDTLPAQKWFATAIKTKGEPVWIPAASDGFIWMGRPSFGHARVMRDYDGTIALLFVEIDMKALSNRLGDMKLSDSKEGSAINIYDPATSQTIYSTAGTAIGSKPAFTVPAENVKAASQSGTLTQDDSAGRQKLYIYSKSDITGWYLTGDIVVESLLKNANRILTFLIYALIASALVAVVLGAIMVRMFAHPLVKMRDLLNEGAKGNLTVRTDINSKDEIGELAGSFNMMMEQISTLVRQTLNSAKRVMATAGQLADVSRQTSVAATEATEAAEHIAKGAYSLALEAEKGQEMTTLIDQQMTEFVNTNVEMNNAAVQVSQYSEQGTSYMSELTDQTTTTEQITRDMMDRVNHLSESTSSIHKILDVMKEMTQQTNLLSLNANIEAARAGEAGKGFMVVANEIRRLADQSRSSIDVVTGIISRIQEEIGDTVAEMSKAYPLYQSQVETVKNTDGILQNVRHQMSQLIDRSEQVAGSVDELKNAQLVLSTTISSVSSVSQETSASTEQVASLNTDHLKMSDKLVELSGELEQLSVSLRDTLASFQVN